MLKATNIDVKEITVYQTALTPKKIDKEYDAILFFSPSAAESFFKSNRLPAQTSVFVIGSTTADTVRRYTNNLPVSADKPNKIELINKAIKRLVSPLA
jgi:uroporphyrinogen-III synthase